MKLYTTREEATKHLGVLNQYANGGTTGEYPFAARVIQDRLDLEDELARVRARLEAAERVIVEAKRVCADEADCPELEELIGAYERFGGRDDN